MKGVEVVDLTGKRVMPAFCDSHTHIVYAKSREQEFMDKIAGLSYEEIAKRGGGILNSADVLRKTSEDELYRISCQRLEEMIWSISSDTSPLSSIRTMPFSSSANAKLVLGAEKHSLSGMENVPVRES